MNIEDQLTRALADESAGVPPPIDRWHEIEARATAARHAEARRRARRRVGGFGVVAVAACAAAALIALPALTHEPTRRVVVTPGSRPTTAVTPQPTAPGTTAPGQAPSTTPQPATTLPASGFRYQPLYPFRTLQEAAAWQAGYRASGAQPWHLDPGQTALSFTGFLGYSDVTTVLAVNNDSAGAHVTVGFPNPNGAPVTSAVVHLRRFGTASDAPWEVVGTDDSPDFSFTKPAYGATVKSPLNVGGAVIGVDENIRVQVLQLSSPAPLGVACCTPAGNSGAPWAATVTYHGATDAVLILAASTGGHLAVVERFTVTGVRTSGGTTPGL